MTNLPLPQAGAADLDGLAPSLQPGGIRSRHILLALITLFALNNVLLPAFLGKTGIMAATAIAALALLAILALGERRLADQQIIGWRTLVACFGIAALLLLLGGEGRVFYANADWQVRDAVLADMAQNPWPFAYVTSSGAQILRAPLGMYLLPALIAKGSQIPVHPALLACNTMMLGLLLALASTLFPAGRSRRIALVVFVSFSGLDILGTLLATATGSVVSFDHLERWAPPLQYSSVITLLFWVPQHAMAGWFCALLFLLHRRGSATLGSVVAAVPLAAIWSPIAIMGVVPFVAWAAARTLHRRALRWTDVAAGAAALSVALPALIYLAADTQRLPLGLRSVPPISLAAFLLLEVGPFLWIFSRIGGLRRFGRDSLVLAMGLLVLIPLFHIGAGTDFVMRASIPPLAILVAMLIGSLIDADRAIPRPTAIVVGVLLSLGAVTATTEVARAVRLAPTPPPLCTLPEVWTRQTGWIADISTYLAHAAAMPAFLSPQTPALLTTPVASRACWSRAWKTARSLRAVS